jgi:hypothetical protein
MAVVIAVAEDIANGATEEQSCHFHGVNPATFGPAVCRNSQFRNAIKKGQAHFVCTALRAIKQGGIVDGFGRQPWQALAWILERRHKPQFNRTEAVAIGVDGSGAVLTDAQMETLSRIAKDLFVTKHANQKQNETTDRPQS